MRELINSPPVYVELGRRSLKVLRDTGGLELPLERGADGKITTASRDRAVTALTEFIGRKSWQPAVRAVCGISAQGVTLRRLTVPAAAKTDFESVLRLQIESEFPLSPEGLAWGWREISSDATKCEVLVAAVRKEVTEEYAALLTAAGLAPEFTVAALARYSLVPVAGGAVVLVEAGTDALELVLFEAGLPVTVRLITPAGPLEKTVSDLGPGTLFISGAATEAVSTRLSGLADCRRLEVPAGEGSSATTAALKQLVAADKPILRLQTRVKPARKALHFSFQENRTLLARIAVLLGLLVLLPYAEAILFRPMVARKIAAFKADKERFAAVVNPELDFLQSFKHNQPPYLDALYVISKSAPPGLHLDSISLNQHGEMSLKASLQNAQMVMDFRSKLIDSGFFSTISVEEQTPTPDRQKVNFRMSAQWKPAGARPVQKVELPATGTNQPNPSTP